MNEENENRPELENGKGVMFHHDNVWPHSSSITRQKSTELNWKLVPLHPVDLT